MRKALLLAAIGLTAACATTRPATPVQSWLTGSWLVVDGGTRFPEGCESDAPIHYDAHGTYSMEDEIGTWRLDGDRLTERPTGGETAGVDRPHASTVARTGPDGFRKTFADGHALSFRRCPTR